MRKCATDFTRSLKYGLDEAARQMDLTPKQVRFRVVLSTIIIPIGLVALAIAR